MNLAQLGNSLQKTLRDNSPSILTALGISGTISTAYLAGRASWKASRRLSEESPYLSNKEVLEKVWDLYIPPVVSGVLTVGSILGANHVSSKRAAAAYSILALSEKTIEEYRNKVVEQVGERKEQAIREGLAEDRVKENPPNQIIVAGGGSSLFFETYTSRYFTCDMETIRRAQNDINHKLLSEDRATLTDFYYLIGLPHTSNSSGTGWESYKQLELSFYALLIEEGEHKGTACIAFDYNYTKPI